MATFPSITPTYSFRKRTRPRQVIVRLGDGYEHRTTFGLNQSPKLYELEFNVSETEADIIEAFLESRCFDNSSFDFTPPGEGINKTGTYTKTGSNVTVTISGGHGLAIGDVITGTFTSNNPATGSYTVKNDTSDTQFTLTVDSSGSDVTSGDNAAVTIVKSGQGKYVCESWSKTIPYNNRATIRTSFRQVFEP